jgi:short-chain Z-isoprenyl diphosphate synthase
MSATTPPEHVGVILDGNRRWARARGLAIEEGHRQGLRKVPEFLRWCDDAGIKVVTLWMLSTDNLLRRRAELQPLFGILAGVVRTLSTMGKWSVRHIGSTVSLSQDLTQALGDTVCATRNYLGMQVNLAIGYGGRDEIVHAVRGTVGRFVHEGVDVASLPDVAIERELASHLYTVGQPDPDLIIRTSGELRLSGFMIWQAVHSELYFSPVPWPEFSQADLATALGGFGSRQRRLGA